MSKIKNQTREECVRFEQKGRILTANERVALEVGDFNQTVTVTAEAALVQTNSAERAGLISEEQIQNIALRGRDYMGLVRLLPGVVDTANREASGQTIRYLRRIAGWPISGRLPSALKYNR